MRSLPRPRAYVLHIIAVAILAAGRLVASDPPDVSVRVDERPDTPGVMSWTVTSPYQAGANHIEYLLPEPLEHGRSYPVVYCLPVNAGTAGQWGHPLSEARTHGLAQRYQAIFVCPAYAVVPWYGDNPQRPEMRQSSYLTEVVVPLVEARLPALAEQRGRFLLGFSKSGHGALGLFLRRPEQFAKVALFETWFGQPDTAQWAAWGFADCYGTRESYDAWNPQGLIEQRKDALAGQPARIIVLNGGPGLRPGVEQLLTQLRQRAISHTLIADGGWSHTWGSGWFPLAVAALLPGTDVPAQPH